MPQCVRASFHVSPLEKFPVLPYNYIKVRFFVKRDFHGAEEGFGSGDVPEKI